MWECGWKGSSKSDVAAIVAGLMSGNTSQINVSIHDRLTRYLHLPLASLQCTLVVVTESESQAHAAAFTLYGKGSRSVRRAEKGLVLILRKAREA